MVYERIAAKVVDVSILGTKLAFRCGRTANNRFLKAALSEKLSTYDATDISKRGMPTPELINVYDKWGRGGYGVILTGNVMVDPRNLENAGNPIICKENDSAQLRKAFSEMARVSKNDGALAVTQLSHAGRQTPLVVNEHPYSCSDVQLESTFTKSGKPIPLQLDQIKPEVIDRFIYAAKFAYDTGFDGVQIHAAHGYLLSQFMSPSTNKRTDRYGGSLENRFRVIEEIFEGIRKEIPARTGFIVGIKTNSVEFQKDGLTPKDAKIACAMMEECGFDFVELSGGNLARTAWAHERESTRKREAYFIELAEEIRPVFKDTILYLTGGFRTAAAMVDAIKGNATDGIGLGRPITAEPDLPLKILSEKCVAAPDTKLDQDDFVITYLLCLTQMGQMARQPASALKSVCDGIADLSRAEEAENFIKYAATLKSEAEKLNKEKKPFYGIIPYTNLF